MSLHADRIRIIESLAESAGFRSRTTFAALFKKSTGLTPSEYWKMDRSV